MSTRKTPVLGLPQWMWNEHPSFILDMNPAFEAIDEQAGKVNDSIAELEQWKSVTSPVVTKNTQDIATLQSEMSDAQVDVVNLKTRMGQAEANLVTDGQNIDSLQGRVKTLEDDNVVQNGALAGFNATNTVQNGINALLSWHKGRGALVNPSGTVENDGISFAYNEKTKEIRIDGLYTTNAAIFNNTLSLVNSSNPLEISASDLLGQWINFSTTTNSNYTDNYKPLWGLLNGGVSRLLGVVVWSVNDVRDSIILVPHLLDNVNTTGVVHVYFPPSLFAYI